MREVTFQIERGKTKPMRLRLQVCAQVAPGWAFRCGDLCRREQQQRKTAATFKALARKALMCRVFHVQIPGGGEPGDGVVREAAHRGRTEGQEEVERGEQHQTRTTLLQVRPAPRHN